MRIVALKPPEPNAKTSPPKWSLPGLTVTIQADQKVFSIKDATYYQPNNSFGLTYTGMRQLTLIVQPN
jgi:hypothetical protein